MTMYIAMDPLHRCPLTRSVRSMPCKCQAGRFIICAVLISSGYCRQLQLYLTTTAKMRSDDLHLPCLHR